MINSRINPDYLPPKARDLAGKIGLSALLNLVNWRGACTIYVPTPEQLTPEHPLVLAIGMQAAMVLAREYNGGPLEVPRCDAGVRALLHEEICARREAGESESSVARDVSMWPRSVRRIRAAYRQKKNDNQGDLFS